MLRDHYMLFRRLHRAADLLCVGSAYLVSRYLADGVLPSGALSEPIVWIVLASLLTVLSVGAQPYEFRFRTFGSIFIVAARRWSLAVALSLGVLFVRPDWTPDRVSSGLFFVLGLLSLVVLRATVMMGLRWWRRSGRSYKTALVVGTGSAARRVVDATLAQSDRGVRIIGFLDDQIKGRLWRYRDIPLRGVPGDLPRLVKSEQVDFVLFCPDGENIAGMNDCVRLCAHMGVPAMVVTDWYADLPARRRPTDFLGYPGLMLDSAPHSENAEIAKDAIERLLALLGIVLTAPVMLAAACAIKLSSPGPVIYRQERVGQNGRRFKMMKFRTMVANADRMRAMLDDRNEMSGPVFKISDDPRVTSVGRWLRRLSIDELPQLFNVVRGDMSLVGPRPPLPDEVRQYLGWHRRRLSVKPGITCLWQVGGRNDIDFDEWMRLDMEYLDNWSMKQDAEILLKTIPAVVRGNGAR